MRVIDMAPNEEPPEGYQRLKIEYPLPLAYSITGRQVDELLRNKKKMSRYIREEIEPTHSSDGGKC